MIDSSVSTHRKTSLVDTVVTRIRGIIDESRLEPGDRIPGELDLAEQLEVSRSVVREAISRLQSIGLLRIVRGRGGGTFIGDQNTVMSYAQVVRSALTLCEKDVFQFAGFRAALEIYSARRAAEVATDDDILELKSLCERIGKTRSRTSQQLEDAVAADLDFHKKLAEIAGNEVILHTLQLSREFIKAIISETGQRDAKRSQKDHEAVVDAIRCRDPDGAAKAMQHHMETIMAGLKTE